MPHGPRGPAATMLPMRHVQPVGDVDPGEYVPTADQRVILRVPWAGFESILGLRGERSSPRMAYLDGALELMRPSKSHESIKSYLGRLLEVFCEERGIRFTPYGAWTLKASVDDTAIEPDECYLIGDDQTRDRPDLAIEVIWTSGGLKKLEIYRRLGVREVWIWRKGAIEVRVLHGDAYAEQDHSDALPGIDLARVAALLDAPTAMDAMRTFRAELRTEP
jgi:Uma2 family endonuclease